MNITSGQKVTSVQLKKMLYNLKTTVIKKYDMKATGNKPIKFKEWESDFLDMLHTGENPVFSKIPGSISVGVGISGEGPIPAKKGKFVESEDLQAAGCSSHGSEKSLNKKTRASKIMGILQDEHTKELTTPQLQRLVLLQQYNVNKIKLQREKIKMQREEQQNVRTEQVITAEQVTDEELGEDILCTYLQL